LLAWEKNGVTFRKGSTQKNLKKGIWVGGLEDYPGSVPEFIPRIVTIGTGNARNKNINVFMV